VNIADYPIIRSPLVEARSQATFTPEAAGLQELQAGRYTGPRGNCVQGCAPVLLPIETQGMLAQITLAQHTSKPINSEVPTATQPGRVAVLWAGTVTVIQVNVTLQVEVL